VNLKMAVSMMVGIVAVLLVILALQGTVAGEWTTIGQAVTSVVVMIGILSFVIVAIVKR
jgi:hypothetical protein